MQKASYSSFITLMVLSFCIMYAVMFLNVDDINHIYLSATRMYMSLLMVSPMAILMIGMMGHMYPNKLWNRVIIIAAILTIIISLIFLRLQVGVSDEQYMQAMIPHHSSAIMTSKNAHLMDPQVKNLADSIIASQQREIELMKNLLEKKP